MWSLLFALVLLVGTVLAQQRTQYNVQPLDIQSRSKYEQPPNNALFYPDLRKYDRSAGAPTNQAEIDSNFTVANSQPSQMPMLQTSRPTDLAGPAKEDEHVKDNQLQNMVQQLYMAQGQVQLEAAEIQRAQTVAAAAQQNLEDAANNVRVITAALRAAQETVATAALRAQTAQLQLAAHDQLLFTARQRVDALSAQMVGLQAEVSITADSKTTVDLPGLLNRLKEPLRPEQLPTPIPAIAPDVKPDEGYHKFKPHSADFTDMPLPQKDQFNDVIPHKRSIEGIENVPEQQVSANDLRELLQWVHNARDEALARSQLRWQNDHVFDDNNDKYVKDFVENIQNLNFNKNNHLAESADDVGLNDESYEMASSVPKSNDEIINDSIRAIEDRNRRSDGR